MECIICLSNENEKGDLKIYDSPNCTCRVFLHQSCLDEWLNSRNDLTERCPICRTEGKPRNIINPIHENPILNDDDVFFNRNCLTRCFLTGFILSFSVGLIVVVRLTL